MGLPCYRPAQSRILVLRITNSWEQPGPTGKQVRISLGFISCWNYAMTPLHTLDSHSRNLYLSALSTSTSSFLIAVQDYQNFLSSGKQEIELTVDTPSVFIRPPEGSPLVDALVEMGMGGDLVLAPGQDLPETVGGKSEYPIYLALPPTQLVDFLANLPECYKARPDDFVFFAGGLEFGNIEDILKDRGEKVDTTFLSIFS